MKNTIEPTRKDLLTFAIIWSVILLIIAFFPLKDGDEIRLWALILAIAFPPLSFIPVLFVPVYKLWVKIGGVIGKINSYLILNFLFFLIITPMGLVIRLFGRDLLAKKIDKESDSYWSKHEISGSMKQQF